MPTAVTGFYGQNVPYPGFGQWPGFLMSTWSPCCWPAASTSLQAERLAVSHGQPATVSSTFWNSLTLE